MSDRNVIARWTGEELRLRPRALASLREWFEADQDLALSIETLRNMGEHRAYFAEIRRLFESIPEVYEGTPWARSPEHFRKHALIARGYCMSRAVDAGSKAAAERVAAHLREGAEYAVVQVRGVIVLEHTAKSQSVRAMPNGEFKDSKRDALDWMRGIVGLSASGEAA